MTVGDAMTLKPVTISPKKSVQACAQLMIKNKVGSLLVIDGKKLLGMITEKDIMRQVVAKHLSAKKLTAKDIMVKRLKTIAPNKDLFYVMNFMKKHKITRLPVLHEKRLQGYLTISDVLKVQPTLLEIAQERGVFKLSKRKEKYIEGLCENCESYAQLQENNGNFICEECIDEAGTK